MDKVSLLDVVPVHAAKVWVEPAEDGYLTLVYHRFPKSWLRKWLSKWFSPQIHIPLERFGSEIWSRIDGKRTAEDIIREKSHLTPDDYAYYHIIRGGASGEPTCDRLEPIKQA